MPLATRLQDVTEQAWTELRARFHRQMALLNSGETGSEHAPHGNGISRVRLEMHKAGDLLASLTELFNGSGELPDADAFVSYAESKEVGLEGFTSTALSLMCLTDAIFSTLNGDDSTVLHIYDDFIRNGGQSTTLASTPLKTRRTPDNTPSPVLESVSKSGLTGKRESTSTPRKKKSQKKKSAKKAKMQSSGKKPSSKKRKKSRRK